LRQFAVFIRVFWEHCFQPARCDLRRRFQLCHAICQFAA
jgi:hypothetical protein